MSGLFYTRKELKDHFNYEITHEMNWEMQKKHLGTEHYYRVVNGLILVKFGKVEEIETDKKTLSNGKTLTLSQRAADELAGERLCTISEGIVISIAVDCFLDREKWPEGPICRLGEKVIAANQEFEKFIIGDYHVATTYPKRVRAFTSAETDPIRMEYLRHHSEYWETTPLKYSGGEI